MPKIGRVRYNRHRKFYGDPKTIEIIREGSEYFVILVTQQKKYERPHSGNAVGIDLVTIPVALSTEVSLVS